MICIYKIDGRQTAKLFTLEKDRPEKELKKILSENYGPGLYHKRYHSKKGTVDKTVKIIIEPDLSSGKPIESSPALALSGFPTVINSDNFNNLEKMLSIIEKLIFPRMEALINNLKMEILADIADVKIRVSELSDEIDDLSGDDSPGPYGLNSDSLIEGALGDLLKKHLSGGPDIIEALKNKNNGTTTT